LLHQQSKTEPIRVMTYNIHRWEGQDGRIDVSRLANVIRSVGADVVGLNEVLHPVTSNARTFNLLADLADCLGMQYAFGPSGWEDYGPAWQGPVGNALLSRYPLTGVSNTWLPRAPSTKRRSLLGATLDDGPAKGLTGYVTHLDHLFEGTRMLQIAGVLRRMGEHSPHFLCGDFNTPGFLGPRSRRLLPPVLRRMRRAGYQDAFHVVGEGRGLTFPSQSPLWRLDFLFFSHHCAWGLRSARALTADGIQYASDHRPVVVEWAWPESNALARLTFGGPGESDRHPPSET
jgi:endonuclease/exonuclease/phosphatase family metal-dependent hydrolase